MSDISQLFEAAREGNGSALQAVYAALYAELRQVAHARLRGSSDFTLLNTTALVHESFLRFLKTDAIGFEDRGGFLCYAGRVMRSIVVDFVRERQTARRGGDQISVTLNSEVAGTEPHSEAEVLGVHAALAELEKVEPRLVKVVEMRYFAGLTENEIADSLGVTERTVRRDWEKARLLLRASLS
jgi:RNA polymerase sigma factor (TIGR02999 family)